MIAAVAVSHGTLAEEIVGACAIVIAAAIAAWAQAHRIGKKVDQVTDIITIAHTATLRSHLAGLRVQLQLREQLRMVGQDSGLDTGGTEQLIEETKERIGQISAEIAEREAIVRARCRQRKYQLQKEE